MTNPTYAANVPGKGRWYTHPHTGETWPSVTNALDVAVAKPALVPWAAKITADQALTLLPALTASLLVAPCGQTKADARCERCRDCVLRQIKGQVRIAKDMAADLGSRVHDELERRATGAPVVADPEVEPFANQAMRFFADYGIDFPGDVEAAEATVLNRTVGYAGTGDLWVWADLDGTGRKLWLVDYKTSSTRPAASVYPEHGMQVAALAHGETLLLTDGTEVDAPGLIYRTAILNLRQRSYALVPVPRDLDAAFTAFRGALATATYVHSIHGDKPAPLAPPTPALPKAG